MKKCVVSGAEAAFFSWNRAEPESTSGAAQKSGGSATLI